MESSLELCQIGKTLSCDMAVVCACLPVVICDSPFHCECCFRFAKKRRDDKALDFRRKQSRRPLSGLDGLHAAKTGSEYGALQTSPEGAVLAPVFIQ